MDTTAPAPAVEKPVSSPGKGKGKATQDPNAMEEDEEEEEEDDGEEAEDVEEDDDDEMVRNKTLHFSPSLNIAVCPAPNHSLTRLNAFYYSMIARWSFSYTTSIVPQPTPHSNLTMSHESEVLTYYPSCLFTG